MGNGASQIEKFLCMPIKRGILFLYRDVFRCRRKFFTNLDAAQSSALRKIELSLFRCYLVNCVTSGRPEKILEFFEKSVKVLPQYDWGEWYGLPYIKNPELNDRFAPFFQRAWQETFVISLHNFLNIVFFTTPKPSLLNSKQEAVAIQNLKDENRLLKSQLASSAASDHRETSSHNQGIDSHTGSDFHLNIFEI